MTRSDIKSIATRLNKGTSVADRLLSICSSLNISVFSRFLPSKVTAVTLKESPLTSNYVMIVNRSQKDRRGRLRNSKDRRSAAAIAHEIGHVALGHFFHDNMMLAQLKDKKRQSTEDKDADAFAAELQMPAILTKTLLQSGAEIKEIQKLFNVSLKAMNNRVKELYCSAPNCSCKVFNEKKSLDNK